MKRDNASDWLLKTTRLSQSSPLSQSIVACIEGAEDGIVEHERKYVWTTCCRWTSHSFDQHTHIKMFMLRYLRQILFRLDKPESHCYGQSSRSVDQKLEIFAFASFIHIMMLFLYLHSLTLHHTQPTAYNKDDRRALSLISLCNF